MFNVKYLKLMGHPKITKDIFIKRAESIHGKLYNYDDVIFIKSTDKIKIKCNKCKTIFTPSVNNHIHKNNPTGCPVCKHEQRVKSIKKVKGDTLETFIKKAEKIHGNKYIYSNYVNSKTKIKIICKKHGSFNQTPHDHLQGYGCPKCQLKGQRRLLSKLIKHFPNEEIIWEAKLDWLMGQRFDLYFPKYNIAVEYNGRQHYEPVEKFGGGGSFEIQQKRDQMKRIKCENNKCTLFEIKYDYSENDFTTLVTNLKKKMT